MRIPYRSLLSGLALAALLPATAACGGDGPAVATTESSCTRTAAEAGLAIAVGRRANSPDPVLPNDVVLSSLDKVMNEEKGFTIVRADGEPSIACAARYSRGDVKATAAVEKLRRDFQAYAVSEAKLARSTVPEANPLKALSVAGAAAGPGGTVILADSGLQTVPPLDFRRPGLLGAEPGAIVEELRKANLLPDLDEREVHLVGIGYAAERQAPIDDARRRKLIALWTEIVKAGGGEAVIDATPVTGPAATDEPPVSPVTIPPIDIPIGCGTVVLPNDGAVGFRPDKAEFVDAAAARETLGKVAALLAQHPSAGVEVIGNVAHWGTDQGNAGLSRDRALRVAALLAELGVSRNRITARGDGWGPHPNKTAPPDAANDSLNRRVVLKISC